MPILTESRPGAQGQAEGPRPGVQNRSSGRTLALVGVVLVIALMLALPVRSWISQRSSVADMRMEIEQSQQRVDGLREQQAEWQNPTFVEEQARLRLNFVLAGEAGLLTLREEAEPRVRKDTRPPDTWWGRIWGSVDELSGRRASRVGGGSSQRSDSSR